MRELINVSNERYVFGGLKNIATGVSDASLKHNIDLTKKVEREWLEGGSASPSLQEVLTEIFSKRVKALAALIFLPYQSMGDIEGNPDKGADYIFLYKADGRVSVAVGTEGEGDPVSVSLGTRSMHNDMEYTCKYGEQEDVKVSVDRLLSRMAEFASDEDYLTDGCTDATLLARMHAIAPMIATRTEDGTKKYYRILRRNDCLTIKDTESKLKPVLTENDTTNNQTGEVKMSKVTKVVDANKSAAIAAGKLVAGKIAIKNVTKLVAPRLPMMVRGYADSAVGQLVIANLFKFAVENYAPSNKNASLVADAMLEGAMVSALEGFNIEQMISQVLDGVDIGKLTTTAE